MAGDPPADADADGSDLLLPARRAGPCARQARQAPGGDPERGHGANQHVFEVANIPMDVAPIGSQIEDRIADELTRTVVGDVAAAAGLVHGHAGGCQLLGAGNEVVPPVPSRSALRYYRSVSH